VAQQPLDEEIYEVGLDRKGSQALDPFFFGTPS